METHPSISKDTAKKFRKIIKFLRVGLLEEQFDMKVIENECGTAGCVMGWAPTIFPYQGLSLTIGIGDSADLIYEENGIILGRNFIAFAEYLGIDLCECYGLFDSSDFHDDESPDDTADRLEEYLRTGVAR